MKGKRKETIKKVKHTGNSLWMPLIIALIAFSFLIIYHIEVPGTISYFTDNIVSQEQEVDFNNIQ